MFRTLITYFMRIYYFWINCTTSWNFPIDSNLKCTLLCVLLINSCTMCSSRPSLREPHTRSLGEWSPLCQSSRMGLFSLTKLRPSVPTRWLPVSSQDISSQHSAGQLIFGQGIMPSWWERSGIRSTGGTLRPQRRHWGRTGQPCQHRTPARWEGLRGWGCGCQCSPPPSMGRS